MIIPKYWAEARLQHRERKRQITVRRFGWSNDSQVDAQAHADARVREAYNRVLAGDPLPRYERRVAYNGAEGVPIREEVVDQVNDTVITRNGYGALCLNTPDVLFADIDFGTPISLRLMLFSAVLTALATVAVLGLGLHWQPAPVVLMAVFAAVTLSAVVAISLRKFYVALCGGQEAVAGRRVRSFLRGHPDWLIRVYRTPAGLRLLAMHRRFDPREPEVVACFKALGVDATYAQMCLRQNCFRARVSPKPWRIGMQRLRSPYSAAWRPEHADLPERKVWIDQYTRAAQNYASCRFVETLGQGSADDSVETLRQWHDELCHADRDMRLA